jgi:hypothetical protein
MKLSERGLLWAANYYQEQVRKSEWGRPFNPMDALAAWVPGLCALWIHLKVVLFGYEYPILSKNL